MLVKRTPGASGTRALARVGAAAIAFGVVVDVPLHLVPHASLEALELVGHLVVLAGMAVVLAALVMTALALPRTDPRRQS